MKSFLVSHPFGLRTVCITGAKHGLWALEDVIKNTSSAMVVYNEPTLNS